MRLWARLREPAWFVGAAIVVCTSACGKKDDAPADAAVPVASASAPTAPVIAPPDAVAIAERERATLLASRSPAQWKLLVEKYPDSVEAKQAKDKLARHESICADLASMSTDLGRLVAREMELCAEAERIRATADLGERNEAHERVGKDAASRAGPIKEKAGEVDAHGAKPGEEAAQKLLSGVFWALSDTTADAAEALARPSAESEESYDEHSEKAIGDWKRALARVQARATKDVAAAEKACAPKP